MITDRTSYYQNKPCSHSMLKGFILALSIHGILFFVGGRYFVKPAQYSVQSDTGSIDVDLMTAVSQSDTESVQSIPTAMEKPQELVKTVPKEKQEAPAQSFTPATEKQEEPVKTLLKSETDAVSPITPATEKQQEQETVKIPSQREQMAAPQPGMDTINTLVSPGEKQKEAVKTMPRSSQGTIRTKSKPGYFQNQPPEYPQLAKQMRQEGLVILLVEIDQKGMPVQVEVKQSSGHQLLDRAALKAVRQWRFQPELRGDLPVKSRVAIPVRFRLEE